MDPLSTAASVLAVLGAAGATVRGLEKVWALKDAPKELKAVILAVSIPTLAGTLTEFVKGY